MKNLNLNESATKVQKISKQTSLGVQISKNSQFGEVRILNCNQELIPISEYEGKKAVSARELHAFLKTETRFDIWIKRMLEYDFIENVDCQCLNKIVQMPNGGQKEILDDYVLTIDCAKEISMLQRTERGKQARQYFIACEKKWQEANRQPILRRKELALMVIQSEEENERLQTEVQAQKQLAQMLKGANEFQQKQIEQLAPKAEYTDTVLQSVSTYTSTQISKELGFRSAEQLHKRLHELKVMYKQSGQWLLYADYCGNNYTENRTHEYLNPKTKSIESNVTTVWTEKGRMFLHDLFNKKNHISWAQTGKFA
jgi:anti-repressor protein